MNFKIGDTVQLESLISNTLYDTNWQNLKINTNYTIEWIDKFPFKNNIKEPAFSIKEGKYKGFIPMRLLKQFNQEPQYEIC